MNFLSDFEFLKQGSDMVKKFFLGVGSFLAWLFAPFILAAVGLGLIYIGSYISIFEVMAFGCIIVGFSVIWLMARLLSDNFG